MSKNQSDVVGKSFPMDIGSISFAVRNLVSNQFKIAVHLKDEVNASNLQKAVDDTLGRYPMFCAKFKKTRTSISKINLLSIKVLIQPYTTQFVPIKLYGDEPLLRVSFAKKLIAVEMYHTLSDANGALSFLNTLVARYYELCGQVVDYENIIPYNSAIDEREFEDAYPVFAKKGKNQKTKIYFKKPYKLSGQTLTTSKSDKFFKMQFDAELIRDISKQYDASVHELFASILYYTYVKFRRKDNSKRDVRLQMPIRLAGRFNHPTMRNFVATAQFVSDKTHFEDILKEFKSFLKKVTDEDFLRHFLYKGTSLIEGVLPKLPKCVGDFAVRAGDGLLGERANSTALSNLGIVKNNLYKNGVLSYEFVLAPPMYCPFFVSSITYNGICNVVFCKHVDNEEFEKTLLMSLKRQGFEPIKTETVE